MPALKSGSSESMIGIIWSRWFVPAFIGEWLMDWRIVSPGNFSGPAHGEAAEIWRKRVCGF